MPKTFKVFISHFTGEKQIAQEIHTFLTDAFPGLGVFRSSDAESIETAAGQYDSIIAALTTAEIVIVLLSSTSAARPWMPFETGFAKGKQANVITLLVRGATPDQMPSPFSEMQLRIIDETEIDKVLAAIEILTGSSRQPVSKPQLIRAIRAAEQALPNTKLEIQPYLLTNPNHCVAFRLIYEGYEQLHIQSIRAGIPMQALDRNWYPQGNPGQLFIEKCSVEGVDYLFMKYSSGSPPVNPLLGNLRPHVLEPFLYPPKDKQDLWELRFALNPELDPFQEKFLIRYRIDTAKYRTEERTIPMSALKGIV